ncbi:hypothetical protein L1987_12518 [Smallanthus sonchifolius]|uniref:Uncharacterized protein n=1 Tax=Smallanthus sonchifolius TaxID=185202 RepID=A0ACB9JGB9_9ASTR|nr:hypothetical protein L1987_12518 [Smallanthus sonchifolius]
MDVCFYVTVVVDTEVATKQLKALPYDTPGQTFVVFEKPEGAPAVGRFSNMWKFIVNEVPNLYKNKMQASAELLTDAETEYAVNVMELIVLQFHLC